MDEKIITQLIKELFESVEEMHEEYTENGVTYALDVKKEGNTLNIKITLPENQDKKEFENFVDELDDDLYEEVIDSLENEIGDLTKLYETEAYKDVIKIFKHRVKEIAQNRINYLKTLI